MLRRKCREIRECRFQVEINIMDEVSKLSGNSIAVHVLSSLSLPQTQDASSGSWKVGQETLVEALLILMVYCLLSGINTK